MSSYNNSPSYPMPGGQFPAVPLPETGPPVRSPSSRSRSASPAPPVSFPDNQTSQPNSKSLLTLAVPLAIVGAGLAANAHSTSSSAPQVAAQTATHPAGEAPSCIMPQVPPQTSSYSMPQSAPYLGLPNVPQFPTPNIIMPNVGSRTSITFTFVPKSPDASVRGKRAVLDADLVDSGENRQMFSISSDALLRETRVYTASNVLIASFDWGRMHSSRVRILGGSELKCKEWMPEHEMKHLSARRIQHDGRLYIWIRRGDIDIIESIDRPGYSLAILRKDEFGRTVIEVFIEALQVAGLLQSFVLASVFMLRNEDN